MTEAGLLCNGIPSAGFAPPLLAPPHGWRSDWNDREAHPENYRDTLWIVPFISTAIAFWQAHLAQRESAGPSEWAAAWAVILASALAFLGNVGVQIDQPMLAVLGFSWGAVVWTVGLIWFGVATLGAGVFPKYVGIALILLKPGSILTGLALSQIAPCRRSSRSGFGRC